MAVLTAYLQAEKTNAAKQTISSAVDEKSVTAAEIQVVQDACDADLASLTSLISHLCTPITLKAGTLRAQILLAEVSFFTF